MSANVAPYDDILPTFECLGRYHSLLASLLNRPSIVLSDPLCFVPVEIVGWRKRRRRKTDPRNPITRYSIVFGCADVRDVHAKALDAYAAMPGQKYGVDFHGIYAPHALPNAHRPKAESIDDWGTGVRDATPWPMSGAARPSGSLWPRTPREHGSSATRRSPRYTSSAAVSEGAALRAARG